MAKYAVILPAAGGSTRFSMKKRKKPFVELKGRAVWLRAADIFLNHDQVVQTIVAVAPEDREWFVEKFRPDLAFMNIEIVDGGGERADTVYNGLKQVRDEVDFVVVHDAARPLLAKPWVEKVLQAAEESGVAIMAVPVTNTLKRVGEGNGIRETVSRDGLWEAQTPQVFRRELLQEAFAKRASLQATDEAQLFEQAGYDVRVVEGSPMNVKITTADDFKMAEVLLNALPREKAFRALHPFADEEPGKL